MDKIELPPPGQNAISQPIAAWQRLAFSQSMNWTNRRTPLPLFVASVAATEEAPFPDVPAEPNMVMRGFWFFAFEEFVRNTGSIVDAVQQFIDWVRDMLQF